MTSPVSSAIVVASGTSPGASPFPADEPFAVGGAASDGAGADAALGAVGITAAAARLAVGVDGASAKAAAKKGPATPFADALALEWAATLAAGTAAAPAPVAAPATEAASDGGEDVSADDLDDALAPAAEPVAASPAVAIAAASVLPAVAPASRPAGVAEASSTPQPTAALAATADARLPLPPSPPPRGEARAGATDVAPPPRAASGEPPPPPVDPTPVPVTTERAAEPPTRAIEVENGTHVTLELLRLSAGAPRPTSGGQAAPTPGPASLGQRDLRDELALRGWPRAGAPPVDEMARALATEEAAAPPATTALPDTRVAPAATTTATTVAAAPAPVHAEPTITAGTRNVPLASSADEKATATNPNLTAETAAASAVPSDSATSTPPPTTPAGPSAKRSAAAPTDGAHPLRSSAAPPRERAAAARPSGGDTDRDAATSRDPGTAEREPRTVPTTRRGAERGAAAETLAASPSRASGVELPDPSPGDRTTPPWEIPSPAAPLAERASPDLASDAADPAQGAPPSSALRMTVEPPDGGRLEVRLEVRGEAVHASIVTGDESVRAQLSSGRDDLREHLRQHQLDLGGLDVSTGTGGHGAGDRQASDARPTFTDDRPSPPGPRAVPSARGVLDGPPSPVGRGDGRRTLDLTV